MKKHKRVPPVAHVKIKQVLSSHGFLGDIKNINTLHPLNKEQIQALHLGVDERVKRLSEQPHSLAVRDDLAVLKWFKRHAKKILSGQFRPNFV